jgi:hypothetical protein
MQLGVPLIAASATPGRRRLFVFRNLYLLHHHCDPYSAVVGTTSVSFLYPKRQTNHAAVNRTYPLACQTLTSYTCSTTRLSETIYQLSVHTPNTSYITRSQRHIFQSCLKHLRHRWRNVSSFVRQFSIHIHIISLSCPALPFHSQIVEVREAVPGRGNPRHVHWGASKP